MSVYVERDGGGVIKGVFANPQEGIPQELLADDSPEVVAFRESFDRAMNGERLKHQSLADKVDGIVADFAVYKALANPTANQRQAFERRVCDVLMVVLKRMTQRD